MIQNVLQQIGGVGIYGVISICLFFFVFGFALVRVFRLKKTFVNEMESLPLDDGQTGSAKQGVSAHE